jgi:hypothetical protein
MKENIVTDRKGKKMPADAAREGGAAYAPHDKEAEKISQTSGTERKPDTAGDERTPDKTISQIKYADDANKESNR